MPGGQPIQAASAACDLGPLESAADPLLVFDSCGALVAANASASRALGCTPAELSGRKAWELCSRLTRTSFEFTREALAAEGPQRLAGHLRRCDGTLLAVEISLWLAWLGGEERLFALARELRGHQELLAECARLARVVEASTELVALLDPDGRVSYLNPAGRALLARPDEGAGQALHELFVPELRARVEEEVLPRLRQARWEGELALRTPGGPVPCRVQGFALRAERTSALEGLALLARDVRPEAQAAARRRRLLELAEVARTVATELLERGDLNQAIFHVLAGVARALGVTRAFVHRYREDGRWVFRTHEWTGERGALHRLQAPPEPAERFHWASTLLQRGEVLAIADASALACSPEEVGQLIEPGERALLLLPVFIHGRFESLFGFADRLGPRTWEAEEIAALEISVGSYARGVERTIAERERAQALHDLARAVQREQAASRYKSEFLASMSHELRTPMNAIRGYAELLGRPRAERSVQELWIRNLRRSSEYLLGLIHDVLDLSKIEAGHMRIHKESTALAEVLAGVEQLLAGAAREKCLELRIELQGELPERFETDPMRLEQILVNLAGNAIKFTSAGSVILRARQLGSEHEGRTLRIEVIDTGIGIPAQALDQLFLPFSQVHARAGCGTGLGLQISRSLARLLGGDITVTSEVGRGSTFTLELPLDKPSGVLRALPERPAGAREPLAELPAVLEGARILVVDDSAENREVMRFLLQEAGARSVDAPDGATALELALAAQRGQPGFAAVLMDMNMPGMDGFETTRRLVQAGLESPVIALTALALSGDEERCRAAGCVDYISKPIVPSMFFETLARHVRPAAGRPEPVAAAAPGGEESVSLVQHPRFRALVGRYVASFPELIEKLRQLASEGRSEELRTLVHRLRGTAASYGFPAVSQCAGRCEDLIRAGAAPAEVARELEELLGRLSVAAAG
jgi:PAS domain S-box-containing protein